MNFEELKILLLEGAPSPEQMRAALRAMRHPSYVPFSWNITNMLSKSDLTSKQKEDLVISNSLNFYTCDLVRFCNTGSFQKK